MCSKCALSHVSGPSCLPPPPVPSGSSGHISQALKKETHEKIPSPWHK